MVMSMKPAEEGGSADNVRELRLNLEFKLADVQEEAFAIAEAAAATESSDEGVVVKAVVAAQRQWSCNGVKEEQLLPKVIQYDPSDSPADDLAGGERGGSHAKCLS